jgi:ADP-ribose pyrophosphatase
MPQLLKYKGKILRLFEKKVILPNKMVVTLEIVKHPGAALIIPFISRTEMIFLKQFRPVIGGYLYELPAGTLEEDESPLACAKREILEETGFSAQDFTYFGYIYPVPGYSTEKIYIFKAERLIKKVKVPERDEIIESVILDRNKVKRLFKSGKIVDAKTICALAKANWI